MTDTAIPVESLIRTNTYENLSIMLDIVHDRLERSGIKSTRCLFTTSLAMDLAHRMGFEVRRWEGSARWYSRRYVELIDEGFDFDSLRRLTKDELKQKSAELRDQGVRMIDCKANEGNDEDLGGHVCLVVRNETQAFFVDSTSYQFRRADRNPGARVYAPAITIEPVDWRSFHRLEEVLYKRSFMAGYYSAEPIKKLSALESLPERERRDTDLNPRRNPEVYADIVQTLSEKGISLQR